MKKHLITIAISLAACSEEATSENCQPGYKSSTSISETTKSGTMLFAADLRTVVLSLGSFTSRHYPEAKEVADSALHIASVLLSSNDFKTAISSLDFTCNNYNYNCTKNCAKCSDRFTGSVVLDSVYRKDKVTVDLFLRKCSNEFGHAAFNVLEIYSCQSVVFL